MFGFEYVAALVKILFNIGFAIVIAIPFSIVWNGLAPIYLSFIPVLYLSIPYWHLVGIILICGFVGDLIKSIVPTIIKIDNSNNK